MGAFMPAVQRDSANPKAAFAHSGRSETMIDVGEVKLHVVTQGSGPPVLFLHGFPEFWYSWRHQMQAIADAGYEAIAPDLRGYNASDKPKGKGAYHIEKLANDVEGLIRALGHSRVHLVGHDWGGYLAWYIAAHRPHLVNRLVILNGPHPKIMARELSNPKQLAMSWYILFFQLPKLPERLVASRKGIERILRGWSPSSHEAFSDTDIGAYTAAIEKPGAATATLNWYRAAMRSPQIALRMPKIEAPTLVLWGERDHCLGTGQLRGLEREAKNLRIMRFADAGHWLQQERPREIGEHIVSFLREAPLDEPVRV